MAPWSSWVIRFLKNLKHWWITFPQICSTIEWIEAVRRFPEHPLHSSRRGFCLLLSGQACVLQGFPGSTGSSLNHHHWWCISLQTFISVLSLKKWKKESRLCFSSFLCAILRNYQSVWLLTSCAWNSSFCWVILISAFKTWVVLQFCMFVGSLVSQTWVSKTPTKISSTLERKYLGLNK